ncbi:MAG: HAD family hydrolase, partial [Bombilactobacillus mellis]|nr:HAD family hydrolase [Bombilactobacillus mellis]
QIKKITALKIDQYIPLNKIFISDCLGVAKPNPEIFLQVASRQNLLPPKMLYIGDNYINDIVAAQQAGLKTVWFNHRHVHLSSRKVLPNLEISSPSALINIVDFLKKN